jgi:peptidoglycan/LPS O-acetylase OafA/YrhL
VGGLLVKEWRVRNRVNGRRFLIRRGFKIWPQYYVFLFLAILFGDRSIRTMWPNLLNVQNYFYAQSVAHTWSLAVEEHAYLLIVLCLALAFRWKLRMRSVFFFFAGLAACVVLLRLGLTLKGVDTFPLTHTRVEGILYGVLLAILYHYRPESFRRLQGWRWLWLGILALALAFFRYLPHRWWAASVGIDAANFSGIALLMLLYRHWEGKKHSWLYRVVAWIGLYSYGIYLWHIAAGGAAVRVLERHVQHSRLMSLWLGLAPVLAGVVVGVVTTKLVELPMLKLRDRWFPRPVDSAVGTPAELEAPEASKGAITL